MLLAVLLATSPSHATPAQRVAPTLPSTLTPSLQLTGAVVGDEFGRGVAAADLDRDGFADLLVGSPFWSNPEAEEGLVSLYRGSAAGLQAVPSASAESNTRWGELGFTLATLDADGDRLPDVVTGHGGQVLGFYGSAPGVAGWVATGTGGFGAAAVVRAGDVDGDGYDDLVVGDSTYASAPAERNEGRVQLFRGGPGGLGAAPSWSWESNEVEADAGEAASSAGDVNGDGYDDLVVGGPYGNGGTGEAWLFLGGPRGLSARPAWQASGTWQAGFGGSVAGIGDVNGDGYDDFAVGAPNAGNGTVYVYLGGPTGPSLVADQALVPALWVEEIGVVGGVGDVDGDGLDDVVIESETAISGDHAFLYYGDPTGLVGPAAEFEGDAFYGAAVGGDFNGDGYADFEVADVFLSTPGVLSVFYGGPDQDADGTQDALDCVPDDPEAHPGAREVWYDGVDEDCLGGDDFDVDGDGHQASPTGDDCDDDHRNWYLCAQVSGTCPGATTLTVGGMTPNGAVAIYDAAYEGFTVLSAGACASTPIELRNPSAPHRVTADAAGVATLSGVLPSTACGRSYVAVDLSTCLASAPAVGP